MRLNPICLTALMVAALALSVQAGEKNEKEDKDRPAKLIHGQVTAVSVGGETVSWTLKIEDGDKTLSMPALIQTVIKDGKIRMIRPDKATPPKEEGGKLIVGTITAASVEGEVVKLTITTADGAVEGQLPTHVMVKLDKDGNVHTIRGAPARKEHRTEKKEKVQ
ncbi:MAG: hypothetical protein ACYC26_14800 [Phycisphaerales bacterium]